MSTVTKKSISIFVLFVFVFMFTLLPSDRPAEAANGTIDLPDGNYYIVNAESGKFVGLENDSAALNSRPVITSKPTKWTIRHRNGNIQFYPYGSNYTLEVEEGRLNNQALVKLFVNDSGYTCKEWELHDAGGCLYILNVNSGSALDVSYGDISLDGALLWQYGCNGSAAQKFRIYPADQATWNKYINQKAVTISGGNYKIKSVLANKYLDIKDGLKDNGVHVQIWEEAGTLQQINNIMSYNGKGHKITPVHSGLPLEVSGSSTANGGRIQQYEWANGYPTKIWYLVEITPGYYWIVNANSLKVMDVSSGNMANGTVIQQYALNGTTSQVFALERDYTVADVTESNVAKTIYSKAMATKGDGGSYYQNYYNTSGNWCAMYAVWCLQTSLGENGYSDAEIKSIVPSIFSTTQLSVWYNNRNRYRSFTTWDYVSIHMDANTSAYDPKVGDLVLIETAGGAEDGPDHTGIIIQVNQDKSFITMEGNTGSRPAKVRSYTYLRSGNTWARENSYSTIVHGICDVDI